MKRIKRLPSDNDANELKAAEGQGRNGSKGCRATTIQMNERLPRDKDETDQKAAER
jgi:hypothetical protein